MILVIFSIMLLLLSLRLASLAVFWLVVALVLILLIIMLSLSIIVILLLVLKHFESSIPLSYIGSSKFNIPGWADYVPHKHNMARDAFLEWIVAGKPRSGLIYLRMYRTRAAFKQAFRFCRKQNEQIKADAFARSCMNNDAKQFWNNDSNG